MEKKIGKDTKATRALWQELFPKLNDLSGTCRVQTSFRRGHRPSLGDDDGPSALSDVTPMDTSSEPLPTTFPPATADAKDEGGPIEQDQPTLLPDAAGVIHMDEEEEEHVREGEVTTAATALPVPTSPPLLHRSSSDAASPPPRRRKISTTSHVLVRESRDSRETRAQHERDLRAAKRSEISSKNAWNKFKVANRIWQRRIQKEYRKTIKDKEDIIEAQDAIIVATRDTLHAVTRKTSAIQENHQLKQEISKIKEDNAALVVKLRTITTERNTLRTYKYRGASSSQVKGTRKQKGRSEDRARQKEIQKLERDIDVLVSMAEDNAPSSSHLAPDPEVPGRLFRLSVYRMVFDMVQRANASAASIHAALESARPTSVEPDKRIPGITAITDIICMVSGMVSV